jgi:hypothetical protein
VLLVIAIAHYSFGRRGSRVGATLFVLAAVASLLLPVAARGAAVPLPPRVTPLSPADVRRETGPRLVLLLLDGASLEYILPRVAEGRLPAFARLLEKAAVMDLATVRPTQPDPVWAAVATGMYPAKNGVRSAASYYARNDTRAVDLLPDHCFSQGLVRLGFVRDEPNGSTAWRARPLWSIISSAGLPVGVVRWPLTYPAEEVTGFVITDRFHQLVGSIAEFDRAASPPAILPALEAAFTAPVQLSDVLPAAAGDHEPSPEASALRRDRLYSRATRDFVAQMRPRFTALRYDGLDIVGHYYLRYTQPRTFRDVPEEERRRSSQVIDRYYAFIDGEIAAELVAIQPGDLLMVVSGFGMQPVNPLKHAIGRLLGDPDFSGTHERAPDGFLIAYGSVAEPGRRQRGSIVDVAPTALYFLGLPAARDMDGFARSDLFRRAFTAERPIVFIPSYSR